MKLAQQVGDDGCSDMTTDNVSEVLDFHEDEPSNEELQSCWTTWGIQMIRTVKTKLQLRHNSAGADTLK